MSGPSPKPELKARGRAVSGVVSGNPYFAHRPSWRSTPTVFHLDLENSQEGECSSTWFCKRYAVTRGLRAGYAIASGDRNVYPIVHDRPILHFAPYNRHRIRVPGSDHQPCIRSGRYQTTRPVKPRERQGAYHGQQNRSARRHVEHAHWHCVRGAAKHDCGIASMGDDAAVRCHCQIAHPGPIA